MIKGPWGGSKPIDITGRRYGRLVVLERAPENMYSGKHVAWICQCDCGATTTTIGGSLRQGRVNSCGCLRRNDHSHITYEAAHIRVKQAKGRASDYPCVDCGGQAHQWSYDHGDDVEYVCSRRCVLYSMNPDRYEPRCRSCHSAQDRARRDRRGVTGVKPLTQTTK